MRNPWLDLPEAAPFVLRGDVAGIERFNTTATPETTIQLDVMPEPFIGRPEAPLVFLLLNPGFDPATVPLYQSGTPLAVASRDNLRHARRDLPFFPLDPQCLVLPGLSWWSRKLRRLVECVGLPTAAHDILSVEWFPYHSRRCGLVPNLPSQQYSFSLVRQAMARNATIVVMRSAARWIKSIPELASYPRLYRLRSPQNPSISPANCPDGWPAMLAALGGSKTQDQPQIRM
jgi:hypothetical protein